MLAYTIRRLLLMVPTLFGLIVLAFVLVRIIPGDTVTALMADSGVFSDEQIAELRAEWNLDKSLVEQFVLYMGGIAQGDLGTSFYFGTSVQGEILHRLPATLEIALLATVLSLLFAIPAGIIAAIRSGTPLDAGARSFAVLGQAVPSFWLATMIIVGLAFQFQWLPPKGYVSPFQDPWTNIQQVFFPSVVLAWSLSAVLTRMMRNSMTEVLRQDYVRTARAKGLAGWTVAQRHAARNAVLPTLTLAGVQLAFLLGGSVIVETVFTIPGMGSLVLQSIQNRDYNLLQGIVITFGTLVLLTNLAIDLTYGLIDPRIRYA